MGWECLRVRRQLPLWVGGDLTDRDSKRVERHVRDCPECHERSKALGRAREALVGCAEEVNVDGSLWPEVERQLPYAKGFTLSRYLFPAAALAAATVALAMLLWNRSPRLEPPPVRIPVDFWASQELDGYRLEYVPDGTESHFLEYAQPVDYPHRDF